MQTIIYFAGDRWDRVAGTDRRLVAALSENSAVIWVDPPLSIWELRRGLKNIQPRRVEVMLNVIRLRTFAPPFASRRFVRALLPGILGWSVRRAVRTLRSRVLAVVVASPRATFPSRVAGTRVLYITDDWVAGAGLMGLDAGAVGRTLVRNLARASVIATVTPHLQQKLANNFGAEAVVLANGCDPVEYLPPVALRRPIAGLVGQLNERLDLSLLEAVQQAGVPILVIGPRTDRDPEVAVRLDRFLASDGVTWLGEVPYTKLPGHLAAVSVGLTPYTDSEFNRASFPLKTLEYLASGLRVVATDLPAVRWLDTEHVGIAAEPSSFAALVSSSVAAENTAEDGIRRRDFARQHSWTARAEQLRALIS